MHDLKTIDEIAERINRSPATIRHWIHTDTEIGPLFGKFGKRRMASAAAVDAWVAERLGEVG